MLVQTIKIALIILIIYVAISFYMYTKLKLNKQKKKIEKFQEKEDNKESVKRNLYFEIINAFKLHLKRPPSSEELSRSIEMIQKNELTLPKLQTMLATQKKLIYKVTEKVVGKAPKQNEKPELKEDDDEGEVSSEDKPIKLKDENTRIKYIMNRPTIFNISSNQPFLDMHNSQSPTETIISTVKQKVLEMDSGMDEYEYENDYDPYTFDEIEKLNHKNRCTTNEYNELAKLKEDRNLNELNFACNRSKGAKKAIHQFSKNKFNFDTKHPKVKAVQIKSDVLGTPIEESKKTKIGSIMPKFKYTESR